MGELIEWYKRQIEDNLHPLILASLFHCKLVSIHPFDDGNGRVSRLLMNYVLLKNQLPLIIIKTADKQNYLKALQYGDVGDLENMLQYFADNFITNLKLYIRAAKGEDIDDLDKELYLLKKELAKENVLSLESNPKNIAQVFKENLIPLFELLKKKNVKF